MRRSLTVIIPAYNEELALPALFGVCESLNREIHDRGANLEFVFVDNSSTDGTWDALVEWGRTHRQLDVVLVRHPVNLGMQQSLLTGLRIASGDAVSVLQSDLQDPPEVLIDMAKAWLDGARFVATRIRRRDGDWRSRVGAWLFYRLLSLVADGPILADSSDFYLFDARIKALLIQESGTTPFLRSSLMSIAEPDLIIRYDRCVRSEGESNFSLKRRINFALDALLRNVGGMVKKTILLSAIIGVLSVLGGVAIAASYVFAGYRSPVGGWITSTSLLLLTLSTTMLIGALSLELLSRIYRDLPRRDYSLSSEIIRFREPNHE